MTAAVLTSIQTLFLREHNRLAQQILAECPHLSSDEVYYRARRLNIAQYQNIVYNEFLPLLLGAGSIPAYAGYNPAVNPNVSNEWASAALSLSHFFLSFLHTFTESRLRVREQLPYWSLHGQRLLASH